MVMSVTCQCFNSGLSYSCFTGNCTACGLPRTNNLRSIDTLTIGYKPPTLYIEEEVKDLVLKAVDQLCSIHNQEFKMKLAEEFFEKNKK